jgi:Lrp/AsnC family transcriptional regulator, regulator for asnA, asnC and gidA
MSNIFRQRRGKGMTKSESNGKRETIDRTDRKIIQLLQKDGRLSNTVIARALGVSEATVRTRLNRLINDGFIQIVAVSNPLKLGFDITGVIRIVVDIKKIDHITRELDRIDAVWFVVQTTGRSDIYTEFVVRSIDDLNHLIYEEINRIDGVIRTDTSLILKFIKRRYDWGTGECEKRLD